MVFESVGLSALVEIIGYTQAERPYCFYCDKTMLGPFERRRFDLYRCPSCGHESALSHRGNAFQDEMDLRGLNGVEVGLIDRPEAGATRDVDNCAGEDSQVSILPKGTVLVGREMG